MTQERQLNMSLVYRQAEVTATESPYGLDISQIYHNQKPHPALSPYDTNEASLETRAENERIYRQLLIQGSLAILLPTEDLQNDPLRILVGDIIADLIVGQALCAKVSHGWFLHETISKLATIFDDKVQPKVTDTEIQDDAKNRLEKFGLLSSERNAFNHHSSHSGQSRIISWFWRLMQYGYMLYLFLFHVIKELQALNYRPKRDYHVRPSSSTSSSVGKSHLPQEDQVLRPVLAFGLFSMISTLLNMSICMPWMTSMFGFIQHILLDRAGKFGRYDSTLDRYVLISDIFLVVFPLQQQTPTVRYSAKTLSIIMHGIQVI